MILYSKDEDMLATAQCIRINVVLIETSSDTAKLCPPKQQVEFKGRCQSVTDAILIISFQCRAVVLTY